MRSVVRLDIPQSRLTYISGARDDIHPETFMRPLPTHLREMLFMEPGPHAPAFGPTLRATLADMLDGVLGKLKAAGITSAIVVDMSAGETGFSVAKVLVPELENPDGRRKRRLGPRALKRILRSP